MLLLDLIVKEKHASSNKILAVRRRQILSDFTLLIRVSIGLSPENTA